MTDFSAGARAEPPAAAVPAAAQGIAAGYATTTDGIDLGAVVIGGTAYAAAQAPESPKTVLSERGAPTPVAWTRLAPPRAEMGQVLEPQQTAAFQAWPLHARYGHAVDRDSAYEILARRLAASAAVPATNVAKPPPPPAADPSPPRAAPTRDDDEGAGQLISEVPGSPAFRSMSRSISTQLGREISRGRFGTRRR